MIHCYFKPSEILLFFAFLQRFNGKMCKSVKVIDFYLTSAYSTLTKFHYKLLLRMILQFLKDNF